MIQKRFIKCGFGSEEVGIKEDSDVSDQRWWNTSVDGSFRGAEFAQFDWNIEKADILNDKVICNMQDDIYDNDDHDGVLDIVQEN